MGKVTVYQFQLYDVRSDNMTTSMRWGTREAIEQVVRGEVLDHTAVDVDKSAIDSDIPGLTARELNPRPREGFQKVVER